MHLEVLQMCDWFTTFVFIARLCVWHYKSNLINVFVIAFLYMNCIVSFAVFSFFLG